MLKLLTLAFSIFLISCSAISTANVGAKGDPGPPGIAGKIGPAGPRGPKGKDGTSLSKDLLAKIENYFDKENSKKSETIIGSTAYTFGIAPRITGFVYLTSNGRVFKLENKNPRELGNKIEIITQISNNEEFISLGRTTFGDDIKQYFTAVTNIGKIYTSEDLKNWNINGDIPILK